jgi:hypothetical protein
MRSTRLIGIGALTAAALMGSALTANAAVAGGYGDNHGSNNEHHGYKIGEETGPANGNEVTADCPSGGRVTGGGVEILATPPLTPAFALQGSFPTDDGDGWVGIAQAPGNNTTIKVYAICTKVGDDNHRY